ncbi:sulfotransferase family protein [Paracoccus sp. Z118]|nr:sulfotransferase family protein [Paracoccus sp. Z118]
MFIHIPKAAGTTVTHTLSQLTRYRDHEIGGTRLGDAAEEYFEKWFGLRKHSRAQTVMDVMGQEEYMRYFRFAFVRNPYTRLASAYYFIKSWRELPEHFRGQLEKIPDFDSFLRSDLWTSSNSERGPDGIFRPQAHWLFSPEAKSELLVDFIGKTEHLTSDLATILDRIGAGVVPQNLSRINPSPPYLLPSEWEPEIVARVQSEYRRDFEAFDYPIEPPVSQEKTGEA